MVKKNIYLKKCARKIFSIFLLLTFFFFIFFFLIVGFFIYYTHDFPRPEVFGERKLAQSTRIYDRTGNILLYEIYGEEKRIWIPLEKIPRYLKEAVISIEDKDFYHHFGVNLKSIFRAILTDLKIGKPVYGASTISQQLIRSTFLSLEKSIERKTREVILAIELERRYPKEQILEWYLNQVPFGQNAYGVEAASQTYFKKSASELSLAESAVLAALIRAPYRLSPYTEEGKKELMTRKNYVLDQMVKNGYLESAEAERIKKEEIKFAEKKIEIKAPHFTLWVKEILEEKYGPEYLKEKGLKIYTTLDWQLQEIAEKAVREGREKNKKHNAYNAALVAIDPKNGEVMALTVGDGNYNASPEPEGCISGLNCKFEPKFNIVLGTKSNPGRQPGSAFKPIVYAAAFEKGYDDKTIVTDLPTNFGIWGKKEYIPENYDKKFRGEVTLREAIAQSLNISSIKVLYLIGAEENFQRLAINDFRGQEKIISKGLEKSLELAREMGINTLNKPLSYYGPSLVLGGGEVKLLELTSSYGVFANGGFKIPPSPIFKIVDSKGNVFEEKKTPKRVLETRTCNLITDVLSDNEARSPLFGRRSPLYFEGYKVAVKTGTTQDYRDAWTVGYTQSIVVGVWVGNNDNSPIEKKPGAMVAAPIFHDFLEKVLEREKNKF